MDDGDLSSAFNKEVSRREKNPVNLPVNEFKLIVIKDLTIPSRIDRRHGEVEGRPIWCIYLKTEYGAKSLESYNWKGGALDYAASMSEILGNCDVEYREATRGLWADFIDDKANGPYHDLNFNGNGRTRFWNHATGRVEFYNWDSKKNDEED